MRAFIPRKLDDVVDFERDLDRVREGIDTDLVNRLFPSLTTAIQYTSHCLKAEIYQCTCSFVLFWPLIAW